MSCIVAIFFWSTMVFGSAAGVKIVAGAAWSRMVSTGHSVTARMGNQPKLAILASELEVSMARADVLMRDTERRYYAAAGSMTRTQQETVVSHLDMIANGISYICQDILDTHTTVVRGLRKMWTQKAMGASYPAIEQRVRSLDTELRLRLRDMSAVLEGACVV